MAAEKELTDIAQTRVVESRDVKIQPGLIGLNMNIMHALDMHMIEDAKKNLFKLMKKEHPVVTTVHKNMIAVLKLNIPREKREGRIELEQILKKCPKNLNTLADLEHVYREIYRVTEADKCKEKINRILNSEAKQDKMEQTTCLLEQGYAILVERTLINESTMEIRITDLHKMLNTEHEKSEGRRRACLERGLHYQMQVLRNVQSASEDDREDGHVLRKGTSLQKFEMAEKLSSSSFPHLMWNYYYAKALNQYYDALEIVSKQTEEAKHERTIITLKCLEKFWNVANQCTDVNLQTFKARSYAYIGHILMKRNDLIRSSNEQAKLFNNPELAQYLEDPLSCSKKAYELKSDDITVLTRYGRALWNKTLRNSKIRQRQQRSNLQEKAQTLIKSEDILTESIKYEQSCNSNWFAYSTRMIVRRDIADIVVNRDHAKAIKYLHEAKKDGHLCFTTKTTRKDMTILAEICQKIAKFPYTLEYGPHFVPPEMRNYLYQALDYLFYATYLCDPPEYHWTYRLASCLFDLGEYEQAVEWQRKAAWFLSSSSNSYPFYILCVFMLTMFEERNFWKNSDEKHFREFLYVLIYASNKYGDITLNIEGLYKKKGKEMHQFLQVILIDKSLPLREQEKNIIENCLKIYIKLSKRKACLKEKYQVLLTKVKQVVPEKETEYILSEIVSERSLKPLSEGIKTCSKDFKYDFFVCHSHRDADWVTNILLRHLEGKFDEQDVAFKGCIADRDFTPGISILDNILAAIRDSSKVILVLTDKFVNSNWCQYETDQVIIRSLNSKGKDNCVIPVLLEECDVPDKIAHLNYTNLTVNQDYVHEMKRLKKALLPGDT